MYLPLGVPFALHQLQAVLALQVPAEFPFGAVDEAAHGALHATWKHRHGSEGVRPLPPERPEPARGVRLQSSLPIQAAFTSEQNSGGQCALQSRGFKT